MCKWRSEARCRSKAMPHVKVRRLFLILLFLVILASLTYSSKSKCRDRTRFSICAILFFFQIAVSRHSQCSFQIPACLNIVVEG